MKAPTIYLTDEERAAVVAQRIRLHGTYRGGARPHVVLRPRADGEVDVVYAFSRRVCRSPLRIDVMAVGLTSSDGDKIAYRNLRFYPRAGYAVDDWEAPADGTAWGYNKVRDDGTDEIPGPVANPDALASTRYRHAGIDEECWGIRPAAYLRILRAHPEAELLHKAGLDQLISSAFLRRGPGLARFVAAHRREIAKLEAGRAAVLDAFRRGVPIAEAVQEASARVRLRGCKRPEGVGWAELDRYLHRAVVQPWEFVRHSAHCAALGLGKSAYMPSPKRFGAVAEEVEKLYALHRKAIDRAETAKRDAAIARLSAKCDALALRLPAGVALVFPDSARSLESEGRAMRNCIGNGVYAVEVAAGRSLCVFIRRRDDPGAPWCDAELARSKKTWSIRQCYARLNQPAPPEAFAAASALCRAMNKAAI